jgi:uncharacterized membrane protein
VIAKSLSAMFVSIGLLVSPVAVSASATPAVPAQAKKCVKIKNMIGQNYQKAQDAWRAQGFFVIPAKDATGRGRLAFSDRNWVVLDQNPRGGTCASPEKGVQASIKKYTD